MKIIGIGLGAALMIFGTVELIRRLCFWLCNAGGCGESSLRGCLALVMIPAGPEECEALVRAGAQRVEWMALKPPCRMICLDDGSSETRAITARLSLRFRGLETCRPEELPELLAGKHV